MNTRLAPLLVLAAALAAPASVFAAGAMGDARGAADNPAAFDGGRDRSDASVVRAGSTGDHRTADEIAAEEQAKANERAKANLVAKTPGADKEVEPPKPNKWLQSGDIIMGVKGAMIGLLVGSLWGLTGLGIGVLVGGLLGYGLSRLTS